MNIENYNEYVRGFTVIKAISFTSNLESHLFECELNLELCKSEYSPEEKVVLKFIGVSSLKINELGGGLSQLCFLEIHDIRERQLDRLNFSVSETENNAISFYCTRIEVV